MQSLQPEESPPPKKYKNIYKHFQILMIRSTGKKTKTNTGSVHENTDTITFRKNENHSISLDELKQTVLIIQELHI